MCSPTSDTKSENDTTIRKSFLSHPKLDSQTVRIFLQHHRACIVFSCSLPQCWQVGSSRTFHLTKFDRVSSASEHACQRNFFIFLGTFIFQSHFQKSFSFDVSNTEAFSSCSISHNKSYPVLTEYSPSLLLGQIKQLAWWVTHKGIALLFSASKGRKRWSILHSPKSWYLGLSRKMRAHH